MGEQVLIWLVQFSIPGAMLVWLLVMLHGWRRDRKIDRWINDGGYAAEYREHLRRTWGSRG